jgi:hypothetical protein
VSQRAGIVEALYEEDQRPVDKQQEHSKVMNSKKKLHQMLFRLIKKSLNHFDHPLFDHLTVSLLEKTMSFLTIHLN